MPTERMEEVEVVNGACRGAACNYYEDGGDGVCVAQVFPGSLTAARLRLADAAEAGMDADTVESWQAFHEALAALRTARGEG